jgi:excisionase family DNA binding protein
MSQKIDFYSVRQAAELLDVPTEKVHGLLRKGKLKARRDEGTGRWMIDILSVHEHLKADPQHTKGITATAPDVTRGKGSPFDLDSLILVIIAGVTLLAAGYTLLPLLSRG